MNFFKQKIFGSNKPQQQKKQQFSINNTTENDENIPEDILVQMFQKTAKFMSQSTKNVSDQDKLIIYGLYKQATIGDCNTNKPGMLDFVAKSKWNAWNSNKGMNKNKAIKCYISKTVQIDPQIQNKMKLFLQGNQQIKTQTKSTSNTSNPFQSSTGLKMVQQKDYSSNYSHPYFKLIQQNHPIPHQTITKDLLLQNNNNPKCYPLHFAIDKQRVDLVKQFLQFLTLDQIQQMKDEQGTTIQQYAQLIQNDQIIELIQNKLNSTV